MLKKKCLVINIYTFCKVILLFFIAILFYSCNEIKPKTEQECVLESRYLLNIISQDNYLDKLMLLKKYETFKDYNLKDYEKTYKKLHDFLKTINLDDLKSNTKTENSSLQYNDINSKVAYFSINYLYFNVNTQKEIEICNFKYSKSEEEKYYTLSYFKHNLQPKVTPIPINH